MVALGTDHVVLLRGAYRLRRVYFFFFVRRLPPSAFHAFSASFMARYAAFLELIPGVSRSIGSIRLLISLGFSAIRRVSAIASAVSCSCRTLLASSSACRANSSCLARCRSLSAQRSANSSSESPGRGIERAFEKSFSRACLEGFLSALTSALPGERSRSVLEEN